MFVKGSKVIIISEDTFPLADKFKKGDTATYMGDGIFIMYDGTWQSCKIVSMKRIFANYDFKYHIKKVMDKQTKKRKINGKNCPQI